MKKRITALLLAGLMLLPFGNQPVYGAETRAETEAEEILEDEDVLVLPAPEDAEAIQSGQTSAAAAAVQAEEGALKAEENAAAGTDQAAGDEETVAENSSAAESDTVSGQEAPPEEKENGPVDLSKANERYRNMKWDPEGEYYIFKDSEGNEFHYSPLEPEFDDYVFGELGKIQEEDEALASVSYGFNGGRAVNHPAQVAGIIPVNMIDVSHWNGAINWAMVKADGVDTVIIKAGGSSNGAAFNPNLTDSAFAGYITGAKAAGINNVGVYYFSQALSTAEAQLEAQAFHNMIAPYKAYITMPAFIDYEYSGRMSSATQSKDRNVNQTIVNTFLGAMQGAGWKTGIYADYSQCTGRLNLGAITPGSYIWMARYASDLGYSGPISAWQYSSTGSVAGITGNTDCSFWYGGAISNATASVKVSADKEAMAIDEETGALEGVTLTAKPSPASAKVTWSVVEGAGLVNLSTTTGNTVYVSPKSAAAGGTVKVRATATNGTAKGTADITLSIKWKLQDDWFTEQDYFDIYNGAPKKLINYFNVTPEAATKNHTRAQVDSGYTVYYKNAETTSLTDVSPSVSHTYEVTIAGTGLFTGTLTRSFRIEPKNLEPGCVADFTGFERQDLVKDKQSLQVNVRDPEISDKYKARQTLHKKGYKGSSGDFEILSVRNQDGGDEIRIGDRIYVTIKGINNYEGTLTTLDTTLIEQGHINDGMIVGIDPQPWTGEPLIPKVYVEADGILLEESKDGITGDYTVTYANNVNIGKKATVTVNGINNYEGTATASFTIIAHPLTESDIAMKEIGTVMYTGSALKPTVRLWMTDKDGQPDALGNLPKIRDLVEKTDYTLSYANNTKIGTGKITIKGKGKYSGTLTKEFKIENGSFGEKVNGEWTDDYIPGLQILVGGKKGTYYWDEDEQVHYYETAFLGKEQKPEVQVTVAGSKVAASNYTLTYSDNKNIGRAAITLVAKGKNFTGGRVIYFEITNKDISDKTKMSYGSIGAQKYTPDMQPKPAVKYNGTALREGEDADYVIGYAPASDGKPGSSAVASDYPNTITETGTYYAVITGTENTGFCGTYVYPKTFKVNQTKLAAANVILKTGTLETGDSLSADNVQVLSGTTVLEEGTDYDLSFYNGKIPAEDGDVVSKGKYTVQVNGLSNFTGVAKQTITVVDPSPKTVLSSDVYEIIFAEEDYQPYYEGVAIKPTVYVRPIGSAGLSDTLDAKDYSVTFTNNKNVGTAIVTVKGKGSYTGTMKETFRILPRNAEDPGQDIKVTVNKDKNLVYNGAEQLPAIAVTAGGKALKLKTDYEIYYETEKSKDAGTYGFLIDFIGNYDGTVAGYYTIEQIPLSDVTVTVPVQYYNGEKRHPALSEWSLKIGKNEIGKDNLSLTNPSTGQETWSNDVQISKNAGVVLYSDGLGNVKLGKRAVTYEIAKHTMTDKMIAVYHPVTIEGVIKLQPISSYEAEYDGAEKRPEIVLVDLSRSGSNYYPDRLVSESEYKVTYSNNKAVGEKAAIKITGNGNYSDSKTVYFTIKGKALDGTVESSDGTIGVVSKVTLFTDAKSAAAASLTKEDKEKIVTDWTYTYDATAKKPAARVEYIGKLLKEGTDYTVEYQDNTNAGLGVVKIKGKGIYSGTLIENFTISPVSWDWVNQDLEKRKPVMSGIKEDGTTKMKLTGKAIEPKITIKVAGRALIKGTDYTESVLNSTRLGQATILIRGIKNYQDFNLEYHFQVVQ